MPLGAPGIKWGAKPPSQPIAAHRSLEERARQRVTCGERWASSVAWLQCSLCTHVFAVRVQFPRTSSARTMKVTLSLGELRFMVARCWQQMALKSWRDSNARLRRSTADAAGGEGSSSQDVQ
jgi:hypothetical protein